MVVVGKIALDDMVDVGGCTGRITKLTEDKVYVDGVYHYSEEYKEPWTCVYNRVDFEEVPRYGNGEWDASDLDGKWN
jgi:hypothetical protein